MHEVLVGKKLEGSPSTRVITSYECVPDEMSNMVIFREVPELCKHKSRLAEKLHMRNG